MTNWFELIGEILSAFNTLEYELRSFLDQAVEITDPKGSVHPECASWPGGFKANLAQREKYGKSQPRWA